MARPKGSGRDYTPEQRAAALAIVDEGGTYKTAAESIGCSRATIMNWRRDRDEQRGITEHAKPGERLRQRGEAKRTLLTEDISWMLLMGGETDITRLSERLITHPLTPAQVYDFVQYEMPQHLHRLTGLSAMG